MTTSGTGSAREIPPGRLSNFEDVPDVEGAPTPLLPPRRPSLQMLAAATPRRAPATAPVREATALPVE